MSRLADYFVIVGYDHEKERSGIKQGKIIQRYPQKDWEDTPFNQGIELFCQPAGWSLSMHRQPPKFFVSVLTDIDADRHYCACLTFTEPVAMPTSKPDDEDAERDDGGLVHGALMFAPKSLALVSRLDYYETFRNCIGIIYTVYIENMPIQLETLVGNILGCIQVPSPGGPQVRFSIGAGDRQALQPPLSSSLPVTHTSVYTFFHQMGIHNSLTLLSAILSDHKVLFLSESYSRLTDASHALVSLCFPLKYSYVYIPLLPAALLEVLSTPTPFIMGVHSSLKNDIADMLDVIVADLDGGSISLPEHITAPKIPDPAYSRSLRSLFTVLHPDLQIADYAFPSSHVRATTPTMLDKEIRAVFLRMFAELLLGYRSCLTVIRIHPEPFITFHKAMFLGHRGMVEDEFMNKVLDSMSFNTFVSERGPPYKTLDMLDELYASIERMLREEEENPDRMLKNVHELAQQLYINENPNPQPYVQKIPRPTEGSHLRIHQPMFPVIDWVQVQDIVDEGVSKQNIKSRLNQARPQQLKMVPMGPDIVAIGQRQMAVDSSTRRLEVLRNCVNCIFENKIADARKTFPAVLRTLKSKTARLALTHEFALHVQSNRAMLEHQQFDLVVRLINCALQNDSPMDEHGVAAAFLPLVTAFCRKLCTGVIQFAYTCIQDHPVWSNVQFWEQTFYSDVERHIRLLYVAPQEGLIADAEPALAPSSPREKQSPLGSNWGADAFRTGITAENRRSVLMRPPQKKALEIAAEQMRMWPHLSPEEQQECIQNEESTVYSQAIHYANRIVYLRVPLDISKGIRSPMSFEESTSNSNFTNSVAESDSFDAESGFEEDTSEVGAQIIRFCSRFVDKVCTEAGVTNEHIQSLHQMVPGVVTMHIETLEAVFRECKRLPPIQKPKILTPSLLSGEEIVMGGLRVFLVPDGRDVATGANGGPQLLPAEGAIFLTTYRVIFKGTPCDPFACEQIVIRCFPIVSLTKEKKIGSQYLTHIEQTMAEGLQLRSNTFQLIKVAFDEEVDSENIEHFRKMLHRVSMPQTVYQMFSNIAAQPPTPLHREKMAKNATLKAMAKKTITKTARRVGLKQKQSSKRQKYVLPTPVIPRRIVTMSQTSYESDASASGGERPLSSNFEDELSVIDEVGTDHPFAMLQRSNTLEKLIDRCYCKDYQRLGFLHQSAGMSVFPSKISGSYDRNRLSPRGGSRWVHNLPGLGTIGSNLTRTKSESFRISTVNVNYTVCRTYPAAIVVPSAISDDSIVKLAKTHRHNR
ncbi:PREDICTED: myotubularin-related protein 13-like [Priapulus caudatus]|uniref:Myotubularin-related protein 13-like n=1 Tax=Priapulus caudatus TaxID=37621 RepID=A0ABM1F938_PRICU|nr:PREDICTED: myotubularin-related protein 13-like [Priapulus caudatus]